ncbi:MAG: ROK family protein [Cytophagaceae bacterium]
MRPRKKIFKLGIDLGGTKTECVILDQNYKIVFRKRIPTQKDSYEALLKSLSDLYHEMVEIIGNYEHTFGIGTPGHENKRSGILKNSNILVMNGQKFRQDLETKIKRKIARQNDSNCFALAESVLGAGKGKKSVFGAILGTGIGGGFIYNGKLITGLQSLAGEWGHSIINSTGSRCHCGKVGCVETFISGAGMEKRYFDVTGEKVKMEEIVHRYRIGDQQAKLVMSEFFIYFGKAISNLITIIDPDVIILGGGLSNIDEIYTLGINKVKDYISEEIRTPIVRNKCGDSAGVLGAALIGV